MKNIFRASLVVLTVAFALSTCFADAAADYKAKCATCHGPDGKGDTAMGKTMKVKDLGSAEVQKQSDADVATIMVNKDVDRFPVVRDGILVGFITRGDIVRRVLGA